MSEKEMRKLAKKIKEWNSQRAFKEFYDLCYDRFFRIAYYYIKKEELSQEIVLDSFMKLWEKRNMLTTINNLEDYCFILVKNTALNYLAKETRYDIASIEEIHLSTENDKSPEDSFINDELFAIYVKELDKLPPRCREIFIKIKEEKLSYAQVGKELNISPKTVDAQVQKAINKLKEALKGYL